MSQTALNLTVCKNYKLTRKLGTGAFGEIYLAENKNGQEQYAAKLEKAVTAYPQLYFQAKMLKYLNNCNDCQGIPKMHIITTEGQYNIMLMELLGKSLEDLFVENGKRLSLKTVLMIGEQMVQRIEYLHEKKIIHRDIKPDNFLMGIGKASHILYAVDFGLSKKYIQESKHIPYKEGKQLTGTARYASINTHLGVEQSRRDDIQSIGYVLLYLLRGILPWQNMKAKDTKLKYRMIMEKKKQTTPETLCKGFPGQLAQFITYARSLKFQQKPDYQYLKRLLVKARQLKGIQCDFVYDWTITKEKEKIVEKEKEKQKDKQDEQNKLVSYKKIRKIEESNIVKEGVKLLSNKNIPSSLKTTIVTSTNSKQLQSNKLKVQGFQNIETQFEGPKISLIKR